MDCTTDKKDGFEDLVLKFNVQEVIEALGDIEELEFNDCIVLRLSGNLRDGARIGGEDIMVLRAK